MRLGIDAFDCVIPARLARHGTAFLKGVKGETINLMNARYRDDAEPLDPENDIPASRDFSKAYIHHLLKGRTARPPDHCPAQRRHLQSPEMREVQVAIKKGTLDKLEKEWLP